METRRVLVIGSHLAVSNVGLSLVNSSLDLDYIPSGYCDEFGKGEHKVVEWSPHAVIAHLSTVADRFSAVIVDYGERQLGAAVRESGFQGPVLGLVSFEGDSIEGVDDHFVMSIKNLEEDPDGLRNKLNQLFESRAGETDQTVIE